jgi:hypothetical protein
VVVENKLDGRGALACGGGGATSSQGCHASNSSEIRNNGSGAQFLTWFGAKRRGGDGGPYRLLRTDR